MGAKSRPHWSMTRNREDSEPGRLARKFGLVLDYGHASHNQARCEKCGGYVMAGDWPWCSGKWEDHVR
jgi:hypothetical protein